MVKTIIKLSNTKYRGKDDDTRKIKLSITNYRGKDDNTRRITLSNTNYGGKEDNTHVYYQPPWKRRQYKKYKIV